jgi:transcriptional regulator with XRE-family HTH domain
LARADYLKRGTSLAHYDGFIRHGSVIAVNKIQDARELGEQVKSHRLHAGVSQEALARSTGISRSTLIDLEQGRNVSISTALKVLSQLGTGLAIEGTPREPELYWTAEMAAREMKRELRNGDPDFAMRVLSMAASYFDDLNQANRRRFLRARPASTGRKRWDALLARTFAYKCHQHGLKEPDWTSTPPLESKWYATPRKNVSPAWKQRMAERTPVEFAEANIVFDAGNLAAA